MKYILPILAGAWSLDLAAMIVAHVTGHPIMVSINAFTLGAITMVVLYHLFIFAPNARQTTTRTAKGSRSKIG